MNMRVAPSGGGWFVASSPSLPSPSNQPANDPKLQEFLGRINTKLQQSNLPTLDVRSLQDAEESYRHQAESLYGDDVEYLPEALFTLMAIHDTLSRRSDLNLNSLLREIEGKIKTLRQQGAQNALMNEYQLTLDQIPLADAEPMLREQRINGFLNNNSKLLNELAAALQAMVPTLTGEQAKEEVTERIQSHIKEKGFPGYYSQYKGWRIDEKAVRAHIQQEITRIRNAVVAPRPTDQGLVDVVYPDFGSLLEALKLDGYQRLETELSFPVVVRQPDGTEIGAATLNLRPEEQSRAGVVVSFEQDQVITHEGVAYTVPGVVLEMIPETVHLENQGNPENLITVGPITWRMRTAGEEGRQFLEALNTPGASVTLTVPRGFLDTPRDWGPQMDSLLTYNWANPHPHSSPEDMARTAMDWVKSQPGSNRDLLRIIAEEIYQGYRGQENGQDNAIQAVRNFLVSVAAIEDFDNLNELDTVTGRSRVLDAVYHSLIEVARTDPRLLVAWLEQISAVDTTNEQGQHVGRAVWTEQGEVVEGGYNLQAGIDTIAALAELTNYPEVLDVLKDQLSGLLKANRALEHERYLVLSHKALGKLLPELDLEGVNLFHANLTNANLSGANLTRANLNGAILNGVNLNGVNLNGADLQNTSLSRANLTSANLTGANLSRANLSGADLRGANLSGAILNRVNLSGADLNGVNLTSANLNRANLTNAHLIDANLIDANLTEANLRGANLQNANLSGANLSGAILNRVNLSGADLNGVNLTGVNLIYANLTNANLNGANLAGVIMTPQTLEEINSLISKHRYQVLGLFSVILFEPYVDLSGLNLNYAALMWANLTGVNLTGVNLTGANLHQANLTDANLTNANLHQANLTDANLTNANLTNAHLHQANLTGAHLTNAHLIDANLTGANLTGANLTGANLTGANLRWADLTGANLTGANLSRANLSGANLSRANLSGANLTEANLNQANLSGADLSGANLTEANLNQANLTEANLNQANLSGADLRGANLSGAILSGVYLRWANLRGANLREADFRGAILSPVQTQYIRSSGGILDQAQPPTTDPDDPQILAQTTPQSASPTEKNETNETNGGVVIGGNTILTPEENLQLLRDLGIDPTGIRPDLLDDPTLKNLLREFRHTGDKEKARAKIAEWLKLKGVDLTPLALPPHTGDEDKPNLEMLNTKFPEPKPNDRKITASQRPPPQADPPLTQALSNLKNSVDPARLMRAWSKADDPQLKALLTFEGLQQVLAYGLEGKLLIGLSQYNLSRFLIAYNTENVLSRIINDPEVSSTVKASAQKMLSSVQNVLNEARLAPFKSALKELERRSPEDRTALILGWAKDRDPRLLLLLGTEQGLRLVLDAGMGGSFLTALAQGYSGWLRHLNTANLLQKLAQENPGTPLGTAAQNLLSRVNNVLRAATTPPQKAAERTDNLPSKVEQPNLINPITPSALDSSVQALRQAKTPEQRLEALNVVRTTLQELLNLMTMNPNEQLQGLSLMQQQFVGLIIEKLQEALKWVNDPQREKDAAYIAQGTWEFAVSGLSALAASIGFLWSLRPDGTS